MIRNTIFASLCLALVFAAAGCGGHQSAGTAANRWNGTDEPAITRNNEARGPLEDGRYDAGEDGRVSGFRADDARRGRDAGQAAKDAGNALARGAKDAARSVGDAAEDILEDVTDTQSRTGADSPAG